jgi:murein DD-endopeptidase MepM/ murein hydrolase activator NlpD
MSMPHLKTWRAQMGCLLLLSAAPVAAAAAPAPSPSPTPALNCVIPPGTEGDPQEQALVTLCKAEQNKINTEKEKLASSLALAQGSSDSLQQMLKQTRDVIAENQKQQVQTRADIKQLEIHQAETARQVEATRKRLKLRRREYAEYLRRSYKYQPDLVVDIIESKGVSDFLARGAALIQVRAFGSHLLHSIRDEETRLRHETDQLHNDHDLALKKQNDLMSAEDQLIADEVKEAAILGALQGSIKDAQTELTNANNQASALVAQIVAAQIARQDILIQAANDAAWAAARSWMASNNITYPSSQGHSSKYLFIWPATKGTITQGFGPTDYTPEPAGFGAAHFHAGIDVANDTGTPILAADDGLVVAAEDSVLNGHLIGYGRHVIIAHHNGLMTLYGHLEGYLVKVGDKVTQGQVIGLMGSTGNSSGPHVHFEVRVNNTPVDPMKFPDLMPPNGPNDFKS